MNSWYNYLIDNSFSFSFGERIHGNIMSLLAGIPAMVHVCDSRTMEMAEFFNIPIYSGNSIQDDLEEVYVKSDYTKFINEYRAKFDLYEKFLIKHGIVRKINQNNKFFKRTDCEILCNNAEQLEKIRREIERNKVILQLGSVVYDLIH